MRHFSGSPVEIIHIDSKLIRDNEVDENWIVPKKEHNISDNKIKIEIHENDTSNLDEECDFKNSLEIQGKYYVGPVINEKNIILGKRSTRNIINFKGLDWSKEEQIDEYEPVEDVSNSDASADASCDSFDDNGKRLRKPQDNRVFPMKCELVSVMF